MSGTLGKTGTFCRVPVAVNMLGLIQVDTDEVRDYLRSLDVNKAIGPDQLPTIVLKECTDS